MEIIDRESGLYTRLVKPKRRFDWKESEPMRSRLITLTPDLADVWEATIHRAKGEPKSFMDDGHYFMMKSASNLYSFYASYRNQASSGDQYESLEQAAEELYHYFYTQLTHWKFEEARRPSVHKEIALLGKWITATENMDELLKKNHQKWSDAFQIIQDAAKDDQMFVIGAGDEDIAVMTPSAVHNRIRFQYIFNPDNWVLDFPSGFKLKGLDWWVYRPERYVEGEVYCPRCRNIFSCTQAMAMRYVKTVGPRCGPSIDQMMDEGEIDATLWDT